MSTTSRQPYSDRAWDMAVLETSIGISNEPTIGDLNPIGCERVTRAVLDAAHDRSALGLDASARVGDVLDEVVTMLRREAARHAYLHEHSAGLLVAANFLLREFEANGGRP